ncbi:c-type cytochrome [Zavarzinia sp. CC-PAN008]|uniref:c-type cytochrome n=1 Tax=Zavarzinia sp. CC-PAN008 TaxID=3243332 RepID=UPI003F747E15
MRRRKPGRGLLALPRLALPVLALACALTSLGAWAVLRVEAAPSAAAWPDAGNATLVQQGARLAQAHCATCHGADLAGQPGWQQPRPDGSVAAPPLDASGPAWQRADAALFAIIARGPEAGTAGVLSPMPGFADRMTADEVWAVIAYLRSRWPVGHQAFQALLNPEPRGLPPADGAWTFPARF